MNLKSKEKKNNHTPTIKDSKSALCLIASQNIQDLTLPTPISQQRQENHLPALHTNTKILKLNASKLTESNYR